MYKRQYLGYLGDAPLIRKVLLSSLVIAWSIRISLHVLNARIIPRKEDPRYQALRKNWGKHFNSKIFILFISEAVLVAILSMSFYTATHNISPISIFDILATLFAITSIAFETLSDYQLAKGKISGEVFDKGLWKYSRHPNYFFEWLYWCSLCLFSIGSNLAPLSLIAPIIMYIFLTKITGIPPAEKRMLASRGDAFREYQMRTNAFFLWKQKRKEKI